MRGKRSKQYRKLMEQFSQTFGFREPYQVLDAVDAEMVRDSSRFKMDLEPALSRTVHGKVKPMITQCEIRKLYAARNEPGVHEAIDLAKTLERRRCGHHPDDYPEPLSTQECLRSVVDPKDTLQNKHRYVVASQDQEVRKMLRGIKGVPLIYIKRSVMILEPMADESVQVRAKEERSKFRAEIKNALGKRKREDADDDEKADKKTGDNSEEQKRKKKKGHGPKGPNPLAVQKPKKAKTEGQQPRKQESTGEKDAPQEGTSKRKRRRRNKATAGTTDDGETDTAAAEVTMAET
ncbi:Fcf1-domain-containing protein [Fusarium redolens]|uniref:U three protein 23 n=1 Tax=Fusarium redolens TaxID=48865 RepID=A0A9P9KWZ9_FUSRE|nr:Fcf1-domain-containing protein [Fusarium redolens]KAH7269870.1 Fcf1-domain-containing protein [Fusarium redolens]